MGKHGEDMGWTDLAQDRGWWLDFANGVMKIQRSYYAGNFLTSYRPVSLSGRTLLHRSYFLVQLTFPIPPGQLYCTKNTGLWDMTSCNLV